VSVTTDLDQALIKCDSCPSAIAATRDEAIFEQDWSYCREACLWTCPCCETMERDQMRREYGHLAAVVRQNRQLHEDGEHESARALAYVHGVIDQSEE